METNEREKAKKPTISEAFCCPTCDSVIAFVIDEAWARELDRCVRCGQKLDWGVTPRKNENEILKNAIYTYGEEKQENVAVEELAELIQAICHKHRGRKNNIAEEIADCETMIKQLKIINHCADEVKKFRCEKVNRLAERLKER